VAPTLPLSAAEYDQLLAVIPEQFPPRLQRRIRGLIQLMRHSGLAIRDAVTLERAELTHDAKRNFYRVATSRQKTGTHVSVPIPPDIAEEIIAVENSEPRYFFWTGKGSPQTVVTNVQHQLRALFRAAFGEDTHFTPHCLRDTAAVEWLAAGIPIEEVSKLLGHSSVRTTEKHYSPWVRARQDRLDNLVVATWKK
jgi:integrase